MKVALYKIPNHPRSQAIMSAMQMGIERCGDAPLVFSSLHYRQPVADVAVFYGLAGPLKKALADYSKHGRKCVYIDLGYWSRKFPGPAGRFAGYHKISVNSRHPTAYFQARRHPSDRVDALGQTIQAWRPAGSHILLCAMGPKAAGAEGFQPLEWETAALAEIRKHSSRTVIYRPKPNVPYARAIPGTVMQPDYASAPLEAVLADCHAVVSHHSNACVEALQAGVPSFVVEGVAAPLSRLDLSMIEKPIRPPGRLQWLWDLGYCQWSVDEMAEGLPWRHLKEEGLIP